MKATEPEIQAVDLFCGAGGLTHGLIKSGINVKLGIDTDEHCKYPYEANNKDAVFLQKSVEKVKAGDIKTCFDEGKYTLLAGCAPCQTFSIYNKKADDTDSRWGLLTYFSRLAQNLSPDFVTMENVPLLKKHSIFADFVNDLKNSGYYVWYDIVDCADYGVPQRRKRLVLIASKHGEVSLIPPKANRRKKTVEDAIKKLPPLKSGEQHSKDRIHFCRNLSQKNIERLKNSEPGGTWEDWPEHLIAECHKKETGNTFKSVYGRMEWDKPSPTMTTLFTGFGNGRFGHPEQDRALSIREGAILQSFPKNYKFVAKGKPLNKGALARMIGNAVPVNLGKAIGESIQEHMQQLQQESENYG